MISTFSEWDYATPGFTQCDLVAHDGGDGNDEFCQTLDVTDVASGWTELRAVKNKAQRWVFDLVVRGVEVDLGLGLAPTNLFRSDGIFCALS